MNSCLIIFVIFIRSFKVILFFLIRNERLNLFLGTIMSGLFVLCCCCGRTRYDEECDGDTKFCSFVMNCVIGLSQFATIILCLVGWCWSIGWGITLISVSSKFLKAQQDQIWDENMTSSTPGSNGDQIRYLKAISNSCGRGSIGPKLNF